MTGSVTPSILINTTTHPLLATTERCARRTRGRRPDQTRPGRARATVSIRFSAHQHQLGVYGIRIATAANHRRRPHRNGRCVRYIRMYLTLLHSPLLSKRPSGLALPPKRRAGRLTAGELEESRRRVGLTMD